MQRMVGIVLSVVALVATALVQSTPALAEAASADLVAYLDASRNPVGLGEPVVLYPQTASNSDPADDVRIDIPTPAGFALRVEATDPACTEETAGVVTCRAVGPVSSQAFAVAYDVPALGAYDVTATVSSTTADPDLTNNAATTTVEVVEPATDLATFASLVGTPAAGAARTYASSVENVGPSSATGVTLVASLPLGVALTGQVLGLPDGTTSDGAVCSVVSPSSAATVTCPIGVLRPGEAASLDLQVTLPSAAGVELSATFTAVADSSSPLDPDPSNDAAVVVVTTHPAEADLGVLSLTSEPATPDANGPVSFRADFRSEGPDDVDDARFEVVAPPGWSILSASVYGGFPLTCASAGAPNHVTCGDLFLSTGSTGTLTVEAVTGDLAGTVSVAISSGKPDPVPDDDNVERVVEFAGDSADLRPFLVPVATPVPEGTRLAWKAGALSAGPRNEAPVTLTVTVPSDVTGLAVDAGASGYTCSVAPPTVTCVGVARLGVTSPPTVTVSGLAPVGFYGATATVATEKEVDPANDSVSADVQVIPNEAHLSLTQATGRSSAFVGDTETWLAAVRNSGPLPATGAQVTFTIPAGVTVVGTSDASCAQVVSEVTCALSTVPVDGPHGPFIDPYVRYAFITLRLDQPGTVSVTATVDGATPPDPYPGNNSATRSVVVEAPTADLSVELTEDQALPLVVGERSALLLTVTNLGPQRTGSRTAVPLPAGWEHLGSPGACFASTSITFVCDALLESGQSRTFRLFVAPSTAGTEVVPATTELGQDGTDPDPSNDATSTLVDVDPADADLSVSIDLGDDLAAGDATPFAARIANAGPRRSTAILTVGSDDGSLAFGTAPAVCAPGFGAGGALEWRCLLAPDEHLDITGSVIPEHGGPVTLQAFVSPLVPGADADVSNNASSVTKLAAGASADVRVVGVNATQSSPLPVEVDRSAMVWVDVQNAGPSPAVVHAVVTAPPGLELLSVRSGSSGDCALAGAIATCDVSSIGHDHVTATVRSATAGSYPLSIEIGSDVVDPQPADNALTVDVQVSDAVDLDIDVAASPASTHTGDDIWFDVATARGGGVSIPDLVVAITAPAGLVIDEVQPSGACSSTASTATCGFAVGQGQPVPTVTVRAHAPSAGSPSLSATASSAVRPDPFLANNVASGSVAVSDGSGALRSDPGCRAAVAPRSDDESVAVTHLPFALDFFGRTFTGLFVNNNGNVTLDAALGDWSPFPLQSAARSIIAPFFADVDTRPARAGTVSYGPISVDGASAFCVEWHDVGVFPQHTDVRDTFQLVLIDRGGGDFDIELDYDKLEWDLGSASQGVAARVGFSNGSGAAGSSFELAGSGQPGAFLDGSAAGLVRGTLDADGQLGRYVFRVRNGRVDLGQDAALVLTGPPTAAAGATATFVAAVTAGSEADVTGAIVDVTLPAGVTYAPPVPDPRCSATPAGVRCTAGVVAAGTTTELAIPADIGASVRGPVTVAAVITADLDADATNNAASATTVVTGGTSPVVDLGPDRTTVEGVDIVVRGTVADVDGDGPTQVTVLSSPGGSQDVAVVAGEFELTVGLPDDGQLALHACATDAGGRDGCDDSVVTVIDLPPSVPGAPVLVDSSSPNRGAFTLAWSAATDVPGDAIGYRLEHRDQDDAGWTVIATTTAPTHVVASAGPEAEGTWRYRVVATADGADSAASLPSSPVVVDRTAPAGTLTPDRTPDAAGWHLDAVTVTASANDPALPDGSAGSGVVAATVPPSVAFTTSGVHTATAGPEDQAGNQSLTATVTVRVDATRPAVAIACPSTPIPVGVGASASWTASDAHSGLDTPPAGSVSLVTSTPGTRTAAAPEARDVVGHRSVATTCTYTVVGAPATGTVLVANPVTVRLLPGLEVFVPGLSARLTTAAGLPIVGRTVRFQVGASSSCVGITDATGVARCGSFTTSVAAVLTLGYTATFAGDAEHARVSSRGPVITVLGLSL